MTLLRALQRYAVPAPVPDRVQRCELCSIPIGDPHRHVVDLEQQAICCTCRACAILFQRDTTGGRFRTVPDRVVGDRQFGMTSTAWSALGIPVGLAFVFRSSRRDAHVIGFPGPAGVTEAEAPPELWPALIAATRLATELTPDVEALLVYGERGASKLDCYLIPIDGAYELAGRLRNTWRGFSGGDAAHREIDDFLANLARRSNA